MGRAACRNAADRGPCANHERAEHSVRRSDSELASGAMARTRRRTSLAGIRERHARSCAAAQDPDGTLPMLPELRGVGLLEAATARRYARRFASLTEAKRWRTSMLKLSHDGGCGCRRRSPCARRRRAGSRWPRAARSERAPEITYKPSALRGYEQALRLRLLPALGAHRLSEFTRADLQRLVARWQEAGLERELDPQHDQRAAGDLPKHRSADRRHDPREPDGRAPATGGARQARADRGAGRGDPAPGRAAGGGPGAVGNGALCRPPPRRAAGARPGRTSTSPPERSTSFAAWTRRRDSSSRRAEPAAGVFRSPPSSASC